MRSMGQGVKFFKKGMTEDDTENNSKREVDNEVKLPEEDYTGIGSKEAE